MYIWGAFVVQHKPSVSTPERRTSRRFEAGLNSFYQAEKGIITVPKEGRAENLSLGGMRHSQSEPLGPGQKVTTSIKLKSLGHVVLNGIVEWCSEANGNPGRYEIGIRWADNAPTSQARLAAYLSSQTEPPSMPVFTTVGTFSQVVWWRTIAFGFLIFAILASLDFYWLKRGSPYGERQPVGAAIRQLIVDMDDAVHENFR